MELETRWLGEAAKGAEIADGDIVICLVNATAYLLIKVSTPTQTYALVLREFGVGPSEQCPYVVYYETLVNGHPVRRLTGGRLVVMPGASAAQQAFTPTQSNHIPSGALCLVEGGNILLRQGTGSSLLNIDLSTGLTVAAAALPPCRIWQTEWRLVWEFGDEAMELCRFPSQS